MFCVCLLKHSSSLIASIIIWYFSQIDRSESATFPETYKRFHAAESHSKPSQNVYDRKGGIYISLNVRPQRVRQGQKRNTSKSEKDVSRSEIVRRLGTSSLTRWKGGGERGERAGSEVARCENSHRSRMCAGSLVTYSPINISTHVPPSPTLPRGSELKN